MRYHLGEGAAAEELFPKGTRPLPVPKARQEVARNTIIPGAGQQPQDLAKAPSSGVYGTDDEQPIPVDEATESFGDVFEGFDDHAATPHHTDHYVPRISDVAEVRPLERTEPEARDELRALVLRTIHPDDSLPLTTDVDITRVSGEPTAVFSARLGQPASITPPPETFIPFEQPKNTLTARFKGFDANKQVEDEPASSNDEIGFLDFGHPAENTVTLAEDPEEISGFHKKLETAPVATPHDIAVNNANQSRFEALSLAEIERGVSLHTIHDFLTAPETELASYVFGVHRDIAKHPHLALTIISLARKHHINLQLQAQPQSNPAQHAQAFSKMFQLTRQRTAQDKVVGKAALEAAYSQVIDDTAKMVLHHCYLQRTGHYGVAINAFGLLPLLANYNDTLLLRQLFLARVNTLSQTFNQTITELTAKAEALQRFFHRRAEALGYYNSLAKADQALEDAVQTVLSHLSPIERPTFRAIYAGIAQSIDQFQTTRARLLDTAQQLEVAFYTTVESATLGSQVGTAKLALEQSAKTILTTLPADHRELFERVYNPIKTGIEVFMRALAKTRAQIRTVPVAERSQIIEDASIAFSARQKAVFAANCMLVAFEPKQPPSKAAITALFAPNHTIPAGGDALPSLDVTAPETSEAMSEAMKPKAKRSGIIMQSPRVLEPEEEALYLQLVSPTTPPQPIAPITQRKQYPPFKTPPPSLLESLLPIKLYNTWFPHLAALPGKIADTANALTQALVRTVTPQSIAATAKALRLGHVAFALGFAALPMASRPPKAPMYMLSQTSTIESSPNADQAELPTITRSAFSKIISPARRTVVNLADERIAPSSVDAIPEPSIDNSPEGAAYLQSHGYTAYHLEGDRNPYYAPASVYLDHFPNAASALSWYMNTSGFRKMYTYIRGPHDHSAMVAGLSDHNREILNVALQPGAEVTCGVREDGNLVIQNVRFNSQNLLRRPIVFSTRSLQETGRLALIPPPDAEPAQPVATTSGRAKVRESRAIFGTPIAYSRWQLIRNQVRNTATRLLRQIRTY